MMREGTTCVPVPLEGKAHDMPFSKNMVGTAKSSNA